MEIGSTQEHRARASQPLAQEEKKKGCLAGVGGHSHARRGVVPEGVGRSPGLGGMGGNQKGRARPTLWVSDAGSSQLGMMGGIAQPHWLILLSPLGLRGLASWGCCFHRGDTALSSVATIVSGPWLLTRLSQPRAKRVASKVLRARQKVGPYDSFA